MANVELSGIIDPYEFEDRGNLFMAEVAKIISEFPDLMVDVGNKTQIDLEANAWAIKKSLEKNNLGLFSKAFERGIEKDILSTTEEGVLITIHGAKRLKILTFKNRVEKLAKQYGGRKGDEDSGSDPNNDAQYRLFSWVSYVFRG